MEKSVTMNLRVNPSVKKQAEDVLKQLGIPMATAIDMYLRQISLTGGIPFSVALPKAPASINADAMTNDQLRAELQAGYEDMLEHTRDGSLCSKTKNRTHEGQVLCVPKPTNKTRLSAGFVGPIPPVGREARPEAPGRN